MVKDIRYLQNIRCISIISKEKDYFFGQPCNRLLISRNDFGEVAGRIRCPRCGTIYEITNEKMKIIKEGDKK